MVACDKAAPRPAPPGVRVVALSPAIAIILTDLGHGNQIVGRHGFDSFVPVEVPICGDQSGIAYERLVQVNPTVVCTQWGSRELPERLVQLAQSKGWLLHDEKLLSLADIRAATIALDRIMRGAPVRGRDIKAPTDSNISYLNVSNSSGVTLEASDSGTLRGVLTSMDGAWAAMPPHQLPKGTVVLIGSLSPLAVLGPGSCHYEILSLLGAASPAWLTGKAAYVNITGEDLSAMNAEYYIIFDPLPPASTPRSYQPVIPPRRTLAPGITLSSTNSRLLTDPGCLTPSTSMIRVGDHLRRALSDLAAAHEHK